MALGTWLGRMVMSVFFVAGYLTYYDSNFYKRLRQATTRRQRVRNAAVRVAILLGVTGALQGAAVTVAQGGNLYVNLLLFVTAYPLLDETTWIGEYLFNWAVMSAYWVLNHPFQPQLFLWVAAIFVVLCIVVRRWQKVIHYHFVPNMLFGALISILCWATYIDMPTAGLYGYPVIFILMNGYAFSYIHRVHQEEVERESLAESLNHDTLTNAYSLTRLRAVEDAQFAECRAGDQQLAAAVIDIDRFKAFNDDYGHAAGDAVLIGLTHLLQKELHADGRGAALYRTGGEEMTIVMPHYALEAAVALVRNCWNAVRALPITYEGHRFRCSISVGVAFLEQKDPDLAAVIRRADNSLYLSKQHGRDRITVDGQADLLNNSHSAMLNYTYFTQPVMSLADNALITSELRLQRYADGQWGDAPDFAVTIPTMMALIARIHRQLEVPSLAMNFELQELADPQIQKALLTYLETNPGVATVIIELKAMPQPDLFAQLAPAYRAAGVRFVIDEADSPAKFQAFAPVLPLFDVVKVALPAHRDSAQQAAAEANLRYWEAVGGKHHLKLVLDGIETDADMRLVDRYHVDYGQGNYFSQPVLPRIL